jgi:hypothetical protein
MPRIHRRARAVTSAIERVVEVSGDCHEDTISYDQHDQLMMKARLDS